jgi:uncharacterized damage-inducible protein DinB
MVVMTYYGSKELAASFRTVRNNTIKIAEEIGEENYGFRASPETRTIGETLVHLSNAYKMAYEIHGVRKLSALAGFDFMGFMGPIMADEKAAHSKADILKKLAEGRDVFGNFLEGLSEEFLAEPMAMMPSPTNPPTKSRFEMLLGVKEHEMHHRAQLMLMQRMLGMVPHLTRQMQEMMARMQAAQSGKA